MFFDFELLHLSSAAELGLWAIIDFELALDLLMHLQFLVVNDLTAAICFIAALELELG